MDEQMESTCAEWCRSHYWQLQERRGWRYAFHESVMVRYYEEANLDPSLLEPLVEFLKGEAWRESFTVHNKPMDASGWKTTAVWYETRDGDVKEATKLKRTRIYHAVYKEGAQGGDGPYVMEDGCKWKVTHEFHWKVGSLPALPESSSGVQYRLQGASRDDDTGLWNCVVERRETVRQDIAEYETAKTVFEERKEEQHLGVKQQQVAGTGKEASVGGGKMVRRQLRKNEDCTTDVVNETVEEKPVEGAVTETTRLARGTRTSTVNRNQATKAELGSAMSVRNERTEGGLWNQTITQFARILGWFRKTCRKTLFMHEHAETVAVETDPGFEHVAEAGGGVITEKAVQRNDEGGFDVETRTREEKSVPGAVVETRKYIDGVQVTTVNRAQAGEASAQGLEIGESVRNEKTEGGRVDQTIVKASVEPVGRTGEACEQNALVHTHSRTEGMGRQPQAAEVQQPAAGQIATRRVRLTDRGAWEVTDETRTGKPAEATARGGSQSRATEVTALRNQPEIAPEAPGVNEEVEVSVQPNEFGLVDGTVRRTKYEETSAEFEGGADKARTHTKVTRNDPDASVSEQPAQNKTVEASVTPNDHGSFDKTVRVTEYKEATAEFEGGADKARTHTTVTRNAPDAGLGETPSQNRSVEGSVQPNDHGSFDKTVRVTEYEETQAEFEGGADKARTHTTVTRNGTDASVSEQPAQNRSVDASVTPNDHGSFDKTVRVTEYKETTAEFDGGSMGARTHTTVTRNGTSADAGESPGTNVTVEASVTPNDHGSYDKTVRRTEHSEMSETAKSGNMLVSEERTQRLNTQDQAEFTPQKGTVYDASAQPNGMGARNVTVVKRVAKPAMESKEWTDTQRTASRTVTYENRIVVFRNQEQVPDFSGWETCSPSISINEFGLLDGVLHMRRLVSDVANGGGSGTQGGTKEGNTKKVVKYYQKRDGKLYRREYTVHYDMCWGGSEAWLAQQAAEQRTGGTVRGGDFPELGCISGMRGEIMFIYTGVDEGTETEVTSGSAS